MSETLNLEKWDVLVVGAGAAGIGAAIAAARNGARVLLVDAGPMVGGELVSGIPVDGCLSSRGEWVVGGVCRELFAECERLGGYIGPINDYRSLHVVAVDPEIMKVAVVNLLSAAGVALRLYSYADGVVMDGDRLRGVIVVTKGRRVLVEAATVIDASGDGDVAVAAGVPHEIGDAALGELQPVTLMFRMIGVDGERLLRFVRDHPENAGLGEFEGLGLDRRQCAEALYRQGLPKVFLVGDGPLMRDAIARGLLHRSSMMGITPTSLARREVSVNTTRVGHLDATDTARLSSAFADLVRQVWDCAGFLKACVPGFERAVFSGLAPRIGIRETRRILCDVVLGDDDVALARKRPDGIAKGAHEIDVHLAGTGHHRRPIQGGGSYDIPFGMLIARGVANLMVVGRCMSATRIAHSSARVMGTCLAMGQAAGTAAAMLREDNDPLNDLRALPVDRLRARLAAQGAILEGTA
ncbi:FAD-dependent oxidoreductase [Prosthecodimorpha staleyi]|uniref:FAD-dependent oxidoreductase n=1 Tax=Prosthecodimorpha staleyi TaxID=2840188 RepID=A0A947D512_9HYPH|nr:FAD-dependent oxidoreductase [Prosthecodimorpha staleyi]MBT9290971.1 FAD-dependent oxidoreductase [Prosthecodimorpha staleyi]